MEGLPVSFQGQGLTKSIHLEVEINRGSRYTLYIAGSKIKHNPR